MIEITEENFDEITKEKTIVIFSSKNCGPCMIQKNIIEKNEFNMHIEFGSVDCDKEVFLASEYKISTIPTLILMENGKELDRKLGVQNINSLKELVG